jgi:CheY-like chemotaxis protein
MPRRVLVDDELDMRTFITTLLETNGFKPLTAKDGFQGLEVARKNKPSLIILDVMMPRESGINLYRELRNDPDLKDIPVIMLSALSKKTFFHSQKVLDQYRGEKIPEPTAYIEKRPSLMNCWVIGCLKNPAGWSFATPEIARRWHPTLLDLARRLSIPSYLPSKIDFSTYSKQTRLLGMTSAMLSGRSAMKSTKRMPSDAPFVLCGRHFKTKKST